MRFIVCDHWNALPPGAVTLLEQGARESLFLSAAWFENLRTTTALPLRIAAVEDAGQTVAMLLLTPGDDGAYESYRHLYSSLFAPLLVNDDPAVTSCLASGLRSIGLRTLRLGPIASDDRRVARLQTALEENGYQCHRGFRFYNWIERIKGRDFDRYMAERPSRLRHTVGRKKRKLEREHDWRIELFNGDGFEQGLDDYLSVYNASWKAHEGYPALLRGLVERAAERGWLRLAVLYIDGRPAAAQLWFVVHRKASIFRLAYAEAWKHYSPGSILTEYLMRHVIDIDRVDEIDFLTGNEPYKQDWMTHRRERRELVCSALATPRRGLLAKLLARRR